MHRATAIPRTFADFAIGKYQHAIAESVTAEQLDRLKTAIARLHAAQVQIDDLMERKQLSATMTLYDEWLLVKQQYPDHIVMVQSGDFINVFDADADAAAPLLDCIVVTCHVAGRSVRVCGVPNHARLQYVQRLIDAGLRVALIEPERVISTR